MVSHCMNQMKSGIMLALVLGVLLGSGLAYTSTQTNAPTARPELLYQPIAQGNAGTAASTAPPQPNMSQIFIPFLVGLLFAVPIFLLARRRTR